MSVTLETIATTGEVGRFASMSKVNSIPAVAYRDDTEKGLFYATRTAPNTWETQVVDSLGDIQNNQTIFTPTASHAFGSSVDFDDKFMIIGAPRTTSNSNLIIQQGRAFLYKRQTDDTWSLIKTLRPPSFVGDGAREFGTSVSLSGNMIAIGAPKPGDQGARGSIAGGAVYTYFKDEGGTENWGRVRTITSPDQQSLFNQSEFGHSVSLDGENLLVGAHKNSPDTRFNIGAAYIYHGTEDATTGRINHGGNPDQTLLPSIIVFDSNFGISVDIDGDFLVVGANNVDNAYVYENSPTVGDPTNWSLVKTLGPSGAKDFGRKVRVFGETVVVGGGRTTVDGSSNSGSVYVFEKDEGGADNWGLIKTIEKPDPPLPAHFFGSEGLELIGNFIAVGVPRDDSIANNAGALYLFGRNEGGTDNWGLVKKVAPPDPVEQARFGEAVALYESEMAVSSPHLNFLSNGEPDGAVDFFLGLNASKAEVGEHISLASIDNEPGISYVDSTNNIIKFALLEDGAESWLNESVDSVESQYTSITDIDGVFAISYFDVTNGALKFAFRDEFLGWVPETVDDTVGVVGKYTSIADINGEAAISYYDETTGNLKYAQRDSITFAWTISVVDSTGDVGQFTSLAELDEQPAISYYDVTNSRLKYAQFNGSTWDVEIVDDSAGDNIGLYSSLVSLDDQPYIAYHDATNGDLKRAYKTESGTWLLSVLDDGAHAGGLGQFASAALCDLDDIVIAYYDESSADLLFALEELIVLSPNVDVDVLGDFDSNLRVLDRFVDDADIDILSEGTMTLIGSLGQIVRGDEYSPTQGGKWYYAHNKPGTSWFDKVDNSSGWTVDFNLEILKLENALRFSKTQTDLPDGLGLYVNDGTKQEAVYFLEQEIVFLNADVKIGFDTTQEASYRIIGKENNLKLFARRVGEVRFTEIANVDFLTNATDEGNGLKPAVTEVDGVLHAAWHDDGNSLGQIYYATLVAGAWSDPVRIVRTDAGAQNVDIVADSSGGIFVVYESKESDLTNIGFVYKSSLGWSDQQFVSNDIGDAKNPRIAIDSSNNLHLVWEDHRFDHPEVFYSKWNQSILSWETETRVTTTDFGSFRPSIDTYHERAYIVWSERFSDNTYAVKLVSYNSASGSLDIEVSVDSTNNQADYPDVSVDSAGKVFVVWQDNKTGDQEIYARVANPNLDFVDNVVTVTDIANSDSKFPVLSLHSTTGDMFVAWEDNRTGSPAVFVARHLNSSDSWRSSGTTGSDVHIDSMDERQSSSPSVSRVFSNDMNIVYETLFAKSEDEYRLTSEVFSQVRNAVFDLSLDATFLLLNDTYLERDMLINGSRGRKEIRFGDFSSTLGTQIRFKNIQYYLEDAVYPFEIIPVSGGVYAADDFSVNDAVINDSVNAWLGSSCGAKFFFEKNNRLSFVGEDDIKVRAVAFDNNNNLFLGGVKSDSTGFVSYSIDHSTFNDLTISGLGEVTSLAIDAKNNLIVGTKDLGVLVLKLTLGDDDVLLAETLSTLDTELPSLFVTSIKVDSNNVAWIGTRGGLVRFFNGGVIVFGTQSGLPSNHINDIAIRNTAIRYIATANGLSKMVGTGFLNVLSEDGDIAANNVKSVAWQEPNILWAGTLSKLNQILVKEDEVNIPAFYGPEYYSLENNAYDDRKTFFIVSDSDTVIDVDALVEVYLNGNRINHGFEVSLLNPEARALRFRARLLEDDVVDVVVRNDVTLLGSFAQSDKERTALGSNVIRVQDIQTDGNNIYVSTSEDQRAILVNDSSSQLPSDKVHFDITPPSGCMEISDIIDSQTVRIKVNEVTDGDGGSGVSKMIVSNFANFTTDGTTPQLPVDFASSFVHDLGLGLITSLDSTTISSEIDFTTGEGLVVKHFSAEEETYTGTSNPAVLYKLNNATGEWDSVVSFGDDEFVDFVERLNNRFIVGVGSSSGAAKIYSYIDDGNFVAPIVRALTGGRAFAAQELNSLLYIGSGSDGVLYSFDGDNLSVVVENVASNIYALAATNSELFAATGDSGRVYRINPDEATAMISHTDSDEAITSIETFAFGGKTLLFAGTSSEGKILRSDVQNASFNRAFQGLPGNVSVIREVEGVLYAAVGSIVYTFGESGVWVWRYAHSEDINDLDVAVNGILYITSSTKTIKVGTGSASDAQDAEVYLKLIDRAGNESAIFDSSGNAVECFFQSISISDLLDASAGGGGGTAFVNENRILEIDPLGNVVDSITGDAPFYSADKIDSEEGVYHSQIFNGTNDLVTWDTISWVATQPVNTEVEIFVRTSVSETDILAKDFVGPFTIDQANGVDISFLSGQFIQFKAILRSRSKDISPTLRSVLIRNITTESVHFFTTNFALPSRVKKGIITSEKMLPVAADVIFGVNTTDSVLFADYQIVDENRLFNVNQFGENLRIGIKLISPSKSVLIASDFDEYGPYMSDLFINTVDFTFENTGPTDNYHFRITFYEDIGLTQEAFQAFSFDDQNNFSVDGDLLSSSGKTVTSGDSVRVLYTVPGSAGLSCDVFYFVKIESYEGILFSTILDDNSFIAGCSASFVNDIGFDFTNSTSQTNDYHFRARFFSDSERTDLFLTEFSGNNRTGWLVDGVDIPEEGVEVVPSETISVAFSPDLSKFQLNTLYYLTLDAFDGSDFVLASNAFTFQITDLDSEIYCGPYTDVPVVKNFAVMFELLGNELLTLNLD